MKQKYTDKKLITKLINEHTAGYSYKQIGQRNNIPESTVYWLVNRRAPIKTQREQKTPTTTVITHNDNKSQQETTIPTWMIVTGILILTFVIGLIFYAITSTLDELQKQMIHYN